MVGLAFLVVALAHCVSAVAGESMTGFGVVLTSLAIVVLPHATVRLIAGHRSLARSARGANIVFAVLVAVAPTLFAIARLGSELFAGYFLAVPLYVVIAIAFVVVAWNRRFPKLSYASCVASLSPLFIFFYMHIEEGSFAYMRVGREDLHHQLYVASWAATVLLCLVWALGLSQQSKLLGHRWTRLGSVVCGFGLGLGLIMADGRVQVGLHEAMHRWMQIASMLAIAGALLAASTFVRFPVSRTRFELGTIGLLALTGAWHLQLESLDENNPARVHVADAEIGGLVLDVHDRFHALSPADEIVAGVRIEQHLDARPPAAWAKMNLILITVDTLRADATKPPFMPRVFAMANESINLTRASATSVRTTLSMGSLLTGRYVGNIRWRLVVGDGRKLVGFRDELPPEQLENVARMWHSTIPAVEPGQTLAERLQAAGLKTLAAPFCGHGRFFKPGYGFDVGFDVYADLSEEGWKVPSSTQVAETALKQLDESRGDGRWFQWVHFFDPHDARHRGKYEVFTKYADDGIGAFLDGLEERGILDNSIVILTADHGEAFGEHKHKTHATHLWEEQVRVPFIIRVPRLAPRSFDAPVSIIDATATLVALADGPTTGLDGVNLIPLMREGVYPEQRPIFAELHRWRGKDGSRNSDMKSVLKWPWKMIHDRRRKTRQLFNLETDPGEKKNLIGNEPESRETRDLLNWYTFVTESRYPLPGVD